MSSIRSVSSFVRGKRDGSVFLLGVWLILATLGRASAGPAFPAEASQFAAMLEPYGLTVRALREPDRTQISVSCDMERLAQHLSELQKRGFPPIAHDVVTRAPNAVAICEALAVVQSYLRRLYHRPEIDLVSADGQVQVGGKLTPLFHLSLDRLTFRDLDLRRWNFSELTRASKFLYAERVSGSEIDEFNEAEASIGNKGFLIPAASAANTMASPTPERENVSPRPAARNSSVAMVVLVLSLVGLVLVYLRKNMAASNASTSPPTRSVESERNALSPTTTVEATSKSTDKSMEPSDRNPATLPDTPPTPTGLGHAAASITSPLTSEEQGIARRCREVFEMMPRQLNKKAAAGLNVVYQFDLSGRGGGVWQVFVLDGRCEVKEGQHPSPIDSCII